MSGEATRPELLALLADCKENPWEEGLRLILADWLDEHGTSQHDRARAELIRAQVAHERLQADDPARSVPASRVRQLRQQYGKAWLGPLSEWIRRWDCLRGLLSIALPVPTLSSRGLGELADSEAWAWVEQVQVEMVRPEDVARLNRCALLHGPTSIAFLDGDLGPSGAQALARSPWLGRMVHLQLTQHADLSPRGFESLLGSPYLGKIRQLDVAVMDLDEESSRALAATSVAGRLERLNLWGNGLRDGGVAALLDSGVFSRLQVLDLRANGIGDAGARAISDCPALGCLRQLDLRDNRVGPIGARAFASSLYLSGLETLVLWGNPVGADGARALVERFGRRVHVSPVGATHAS